MTYSRRVLYPSSAHTLAYMSAKRASKSSRRPRSSPTKTTHVSACPSDASDDASDAPPPSSRLRARRARAAKVVRARLFGLARDHHGQVALPQHHQPRALSVVPLERVAEARRARERLGELPVETGPQAPGGHHEHQVFFGHGAVVDERKLEPLRGERAVQIARA